MNQSSTEHSFNILQQQLASRSILRIVIETFLHFALVVVGTLGNSLVLWVVFKNKNSTKLAYIFIGALAASDFLVLVLTGWIFLTVLVLGKWQFSHFICQFQGFCVSGFVCLSLFLMAITAINRYFKVVRNKHYRAVFTPKRTKNIIIGTAMLSFIGPTQYLASGRRYVFQPGKYFCHQETRLTPSTSWVLYGVLVPTIIINVCYIMIFHTIRLHQNRVKAMRQNNPITGPNIEDIKATRTLFFTVVGFLCCWTPIFVIDIVDFARNSSIPHREVYVVYTLLGTFSSCINPFIYGAMNTMFSQEYKKIFRFRYLCGTKVERIIQTNSRVTVGQGANTTFSSDFHYQNNRQ